MPIKAIKSDVFKFLENSKQQYSIIFADPPYNFNIDLFTKIPQFVFENNLLYNEGLLIIEHSKHTDLSDLYNYSHSKKYGGNMFSFFEHSL
jgi:16S rRNA G966 N2-methylase RsmD